MRESTVDANATTEDISSLQEIEKWRILRAEAIEKGEGVLTASDQVRFILHIIPENSLERKVLTESWQLTNEDKLNIYVANGESRSSYNADGFISVAGNGVQESPYGYTQIFRSGIVEYVDSYCYGVPFQGLDKMVLAQKIEQGFVRCYKDALKRLKKSSVDQPVYFGFSLTGIKGKPFFTNHVWSTNPTNLPLPTQNIYHSPVAQIEFGDVEESPYRRALLPLVNLFWQISGRESTPFKTNGLWDPFRQY